MPTMKADLAASNRGFSSVDIAPQLHTVISLRRARLRASNTPTAQKSVLFNDNALHHTVRYIVTPEITKKRDPIA
jgi:hypothetical protein